MNDPMIWVRVLHFAATVMVVGANFFLIFVAEPAFRRLQNNGVVAAIVRSQLAWIVWMSIAIVLISGAAWLVLQSQQMSDLSLVAVFSEGTVWTVLTQTDFGQVWAARSVLAGILMGAMFLLQSEPWLNSYPMRVLTVLLAACLAGTLA